MPSEANAAQQRLPLSEETRIVRIKACTSISKLATVMADELYVSQGTGQKPTRLSAATKTVFIFPRRFMIKYQKPLLV